MTQRKYFIMLGGILNFNNESMKKKIILASFILLALLISGCSLTKDKYGSEEDCDAACVDQEYVEGTCLGEGEAGEGMEEAGNCLFRQSDECSKPSECKCYCSDRDAADGVTTILKDIEKETGIDFSSVEDATATWQVPKGGEETGDATVEQISLLGKGFGAEKIPQTQYMAIELFLENQGFEVDAYNVAAGTVSGMAGYKKDTMVCVVTGGVTGYKEAGDQWVPEDTSKYDIEVNCAIGSEDTLNPILSKEDAIKKLLADKNGKKTSEVTVTIEKETENHVRGGVEFEPSESEDSKTFLAVNSNNEWMLAFDGNGAISCEQMSLYDFPEEMTEDCENTQTIGVKEDEEFTITLQANATTGYSWIAEVDDDYIELVSKEYEADEEEDEDENEDKVGEGGAEVFTFLALKTGETKITFSYAREWESKQPVDKKLYMIEIE